LTIFDRLKLEQEQAKTQSMLEHLKMKGAE